MENKLLFIQTKDGLSLTDGVSAPLVVTESTPGAKEIMQIIDSGSFEELTIDDLRKKTSIAEKLSFEKDDVRFEFDEKAKDLKLFVDGKESNIPMSASFKKRIVETLKAVEAMGGKFKMSMFCAFVKKLSKNPSFKVVKSLYDFLSVNNVPLTENGNFRAYKKVDFDYMDLHSHTIRNAIGDEPSMNRNEVEDDPNKCCSAGLHACSKSYLEHYGSNDSAVNRIVIVEIDPVDVVSIPTDYNNAKMRVCKYKVVDELTDFDAQLSSYVTGYHKDGWLAGLLPRVRKFYAKFWGIGDSEKFDWNCIGDEEAMTDGLSAKFVKDFKTEFAADLGDAAIDDDYVIVLAQTPLDAINFLSQYDQAALTKPAGDGDGE
jgi:hypothetical protein